MPCAVLTGGPGAGKTTLLAELAARGFAIVSESAREVIAERLAAGLPPRPEPHAFAREILRRDLERYAGHSATERWTFFDRSAIEALGMAHEAGALDEEELQAHLGSVTFAAVYALPPWPEIFVADQERDQTAEQAFTIYASVVRWYRRCGYEPHQVPRLPVAERADYVLRTLGLRAA